MGVASIQDEIVFQKEMIFAAAFVLVWLVGVGAWVFGVVESWAINKLTGRFSSAGPVLLRETISRFPTLESLDSRVTLSSVQLRLLRPDLVVLGPLRASAAVRSLSFAIKGQVQYREGRAEVTIRAQLGVVLFMAAWIAAALIWTVAAAIFMPVHFFLGGIAVSVGGGLFMLRLWRSTQKDADVALAELKGFLEERKD